MKTRRKPGLRRLRLKLLAYGNCHYIERIAALEKMLAQKPRRLQIEMIGDGEIPADMALLFRAILMERKPGTRIITQARSSLQNGSVLVWLLGDQRIIRNDARLFFRATNLPAVDTSDEVWKDKGLFGQSTADVDPEEYDHARVLELINEFLPVKELTGKIIGLPVLRQFGLVENETLDRFLAIALGKNSSDSPEPGKKPDRQAVKVPQK